MTKRERVGGSKTAIFGVAIKVDVGWTLLLVSVIPSSFVSS